MQTCLCQSVCVCQKRMGTCAAGALPVWRKSIQVMCECSCCVGACACACVYSHSHVSTLSGTTAAIAVKYLVRLDEICNHMDMPTSQ
jgi:hypothetical protein